MNDPTHSICNYYPFSVTVSESCHIAMVAIFGGVTGFLTVYAFVVFKIG